MGGVCNQITLLILYYISSRAEVTDAIYKSLTFFYVTVSFKFKIFSFQMVLNCLQA